jgi:hypothetical protein
MWAFSFALSLGAGILSGLLIGAIFGWVWSAAAPAFGAAFFLLGWMCPWVIEYASRVWNKSAREFVRFGRQWVLAVFYYVVLVPVAWTGSLLRVDAPKSGESLWVEHRPFSADTEPRPCSTQSWLAAYLSWCGRDRHLWTIWLIPFLLLLSALGAEGQKRSVPSNIYTLY